MTDSRPHSEPLESDRKPFSTVPFPHDPDFITRDALLDQIQEKSSIPGSRIVLVGLGGVGKTRLVIEYCHRIRQQSTNTWVFWIHASDAGRFEESLRDLADRVEIPGHQDRNTNIFQLVRNWLQDERIGKWILVLDNVDDDELWKLSVTSTKDQNKVHSNASTKPPLRYLLEISTGYIIITSRNKRVASDIAGHNNIIEVPPMGNAEALDLLQTKLTKTPGSKELPKLVQLAEELEFMPLAIVQAASFINQRSPRCSITQYLEKLRKSDHEATRLLNHEAGQMHRDWEAKNSILLTWQISFSHIQQTRRSAAELLSLMSFFDRQGIPEILLRLPDMESQSTYLNSLENDANNFSEEDTDSASESDLYHGFEDDIATLRAYSFISIGEDCITFSMHRLVQLTVRTWLKSQGQLELWKERFITVLCQKFPTCEYENWAMCRQIFPHQCYCGQNPMIPNENGLRYFIEVHGTRGKWALSRMLGRWHSNQGSRE
ncbi:hypothetical protein N7540_000002 [Penicillium herquei]|nr:hypothetical protein N7540_000002 [Penicillium herquei]